MARTVTTATYWPMPRVSPRVLNRTYTGTSRSWSGIISVASTTRKRISRPGNRSRAKAYPAMLPRTRLLMVTASARIALFAKRTGNGGFNLVSAYSQPAVVTGCGMTFNVTESGSVLNDVITDQPNGTNIRIA